MARIRTIKPDAFTSDSLSSVSVLARWTFAGIWTHCDDEGRGRADARLIKAALFPLDDSINVPHVDKVLDELESIGAICRYEAAGKLYLHCPKWSLHQRINRPSESKMPECSRPTHGGFSEESVKNHGGLTEDALACVDRKGTGKREQGSEPAPERVSVLDDKFAAFWAAYPRKTDKAKSRTAWTKATKTNTPDLLITAARKYATSKATTEQRYILHPSTWLNGERWADEADSNVHQLRTDEQGHPVLPPLPGSSPWATVNA